ncbi:hypothetical protein Val02_13060 [Virgisporangium aliadipatigenens]|uniref:Sel1 repeat family protein n=1 Tax=Virgisporangium aliadipatigenens TaxID=741659 RepID=A0A8J3YI33_9ACTN|nr:sel1 repeat family protein [Virgisporangium aliadipatigenens]GIJ44420.1 hypothetical protein Val02_13060 [Virgisporangium aliadipatigenens]
MPLTDLTRAFRDDDQRQWAAEIVQDHLADDRIQEECHSLMRFWWQLSTELPQIDETELAATVGPDKLAAVEALIAALRTSHEAVDAWIHDTSERFPWIEDRGWDAGVAWRRSLTFDEPEPVAVPQPRLEVQPPAPRPDGVDAAGARVAFDAGVDGAAMRLATILEHDGDLDGAAAAYRLAAESDDPWALYALGRVYLAKLPPDWRNSDQGLCVWRIDEVWQHAADLGLVEAMYAVALLEDPTDGRSVRYLRQAAALGHAPSCYALGYNAHQRGDRAEAVEWWTKAGGYPPAVEALRSVSGA